MVLRYITEISKIWSSWVFAFSGILGIYTQVTGQNILFYPWVYWTVAFSCFLGANLMLYQRLSTKISRYEADEPNLVLTVTDPLFNITNPSSVWFISDDAPNDGLDEYGMPEGVFITANVEIENLGREPGVFEWSLESVNLGSFFLLYPEEIKGTIEGFSGVVPGRDRFIGKWQLRLWPKENHISKFAERIQNPGKYEIIISYWTKKLGGKSKENSLVICGELSDFVVQLATKWNNRGWSNFARIALKDLQTGDN